MIIVIVNKSSNCLQILFISLSNYSNKFNGSSVEGGNLKLVPESITS